MKLGIDPKILVVGLIALAGLLFWFNSRGDEVPSSGQAAAARSAEPASVPVASSRARTTSDRRRSGRDDRATLKLRAVAPGTGEVDPVLRLDLLEKLAKVELPAQARNLFEMGPAAPPPQTAALPVRTIVPKPVVVQPVVAAQPVTPQVNIPLKYYGFAKPSTRGEANRGFFMDGDDILVAAEGQTLQGRYRVERLTPTGAKLEDTQVKLSQMMPVTPEALEQGSNANAYNRQQQMMPGMQQQQQMDPNNPTIPAPDNPGDPNEP
jgi:hypothetical protein